MHGVTTIDAHRSAGTGLVDQDDPVAGPVADDRRSPPGEAGQHQLALDPVGNRVAGLGVHRLDQEVVLEDVEAIVLGWRWFAELEIGGVTLHLNSIGDEVCRPAYRELLRFGSQVEVLEPAELRDRIAETSRDVAAMYGR